MTDCIACGATAALQHPDPLEMLPFWTWLNDSETIGLCSYCAAIPFDDLLIKIRIRQESIVLAGAEIARRMQA